MFRPADVFHSDHSACSSGRSATLFSIEAPGRDPTPPTCSRGKAPPNSCEGSEGLCKISCSEALTPSPGPAVSVEPLLLPRGCVRLEWSLWVVWRQGLTEVVLDGVYNTSRKVLHGSTDDGLGEVGSAGGGL